MLPPRRHRLRELGFRVVVALQQRGCCFQEPHMLLDRVDHDGSAHPPPLVPLHPAFAVAPYVVGQRSVVYRKCQLFARGYKCGRHVLFRSLDISEPSTRASILCWRDKLGTGDEYRTWKVETDDNTQLSGVSPWGPKTCMYELGSIGARFLTNTGSGVFFHCSKSATISCCTRFASEGNKNPRE